MKRILSLTLLPLVLLFPHLSQAKPTNNVMKMRSAATVSGALDKEKGILYSVGLEYRMTDTATKFDEVFAEGALGYVIAPGLVIWGGLRSIIAPESRSNASTVQKQHPFTQLIWQMYNQPGMAITSRTRLEERYENNEWKTRLRQRLAIEFPDKWGVLSPLLYNEVHFNVGRGYAIPENRTFAGVYFPTGPRSKLEVGYLNQQGYSTSSNTLSHNLYLSLKVSTG